MIDLRERHEDLANFASVVAAIDIRPFEISDGPLNTLVLIIEKRASDADALFGDLADCDGESASTTQIGDLAFMAKLELRQRSERLVRRATKGDSWAIIEECSSLRRHLIHSAAQVDKALCEETGAVSLFGDLLASDLDTALASRHAYLSFVRATRRIQAQVANGTMLHMQALRQCAATIAKLIGRDVYQELRIGDRQQLRGLQRRIFAWATDHQGDELEARRLRQDVSGFAELLVRIHHRSALIEHDSNFLSELLGCDAPPTPEQLEQLDMLEGRSPELDQILAGAERPWPAIKSAITSLQHDLALTLGRAGLQSSANPLNVS